MHKSLILWDVLLQCQLSRGWHRDVLSLAHLTDMAERKEASPQCISGTIRDKHCQMHSYTLHLVFTWAILKKWMILKTLQMLPTQSGSSDSSECRLVTWGIKPQTWRKEEKHMPCCTFLNTYSHFQAVKRKEKDSKAFKAIKTTMRAQTENWRYIIEKRSL